RRIEMGNKARAVVAGRERQSGLAIVKQLFVESHAEALQGATLYLAVRGNGIDDTSAVVSAEKSRYSHVAGLDVDFYFGEIRYEAESRRVSDDGLRTCRGSQDLRPFRHALFRNLPFEITRSFNNGRARENRRSSTGFADRRRAT